MQIFDSTSKMLVMNYILNKNILKEYIDRIPKSKVF